MDRLCVLAGVRREHPVVGQVLRHLGPEADFAVRREHIFRWQFASCSERLYRDANCRTRHTGNWRRGDHYSGEYLYQ